MKHMESHREYSELEGTHKDPRVQLPSEWPGIEPVTLALPAPCSQQHSAPGQNEFKFSMLDKTGQMGTLLLSQSKQRREQGFWRVKLLLRAKYDQWSNWAQRESFFQEYPVYCSELQCSFSPPSLEDEQAQMPYTNVLLVLPLQSYSKGKIL